MANGHKAIKPARRLGLSSTPSITGREGDSETFVTGAIVIDDGSGLVDEAGTSPQDLILGIAMQAASNVTTNPDVRIVPALPGMVFEGTLDDSSDAGAGVSAETVWWGHYGVTEDADGIWYVDLNKTTDDTDTSVMVTKILGTIGDTTPQVEFVFLPQVTAWGSTRS